MKRIITVLMVLLPLLSIAQEKNDNQIIVTPNQTEDTFISSIELLSMAGYVFTYTDTDLQYAVTGPINIKGGDINVYIHVVDGKIIIQGTVTSDTLGFLDDVKFKGANNSPAMRSWNKMNELAILLGTCEYRKVGKE